MIWPIFPVLFSFKSFRFNIATDLIPVDHDSWGWKAVQQLCGVGSPPSSALSSPTRCGQHGRYLHGFLGSSLMCQGTPPIQSETSTPDAFQAYNYISQCNYLRRTSHLPFKACTVLGLAFLLLQLLLYGSDRDGNIRQI